jgi:EAL domain-containing protein (putative c-di-GMP-specific phosphodiesterase class I)
MTQIEFKQLILEAKYFTKYEAILDKESLEIYGYEALSKFDIKNEIINTEEIFKKLHHNNKLFFELEKRNKKLQLESYLLNHKLFLNFDADIVVTEDQKNYWCDFLMNYKDKVVIEITENGSDDETSAEIMRSFSNWLKSNKIDAALDDFAQDGSMFSFHIMNNCKYIKIDKSFLHEIKKNKNYIYYLNGLLQTIKLNGQKSIIEGVETLDDLNLVKNLECDFIQGYFFSDLSFSI